MVPTFLYFCASLQRSNGDQRLAGSDTTAISLRAVFYFLVQNPQSYGKVQQEIDSADREGRLSEYITYAECLEMPYLQVLHLAAKAIYLTMPC